MKRIYFIFLFLSILSCTSDTMNEVPSAAINLNVSLGRNFVLGDLVTGDNSPWIHDYEGPVTVQFSSINTEYSKSLTFDPNDTETLASTVLRYGEFTWEVANSGTDVRVTSELPVYGNSTSNLIIDSAAPSVSLPLSTDFALVTISTQNVSEISLEHNNQLYSPWVKDGYYYWYVNSLYSDYTLHVKTYDGYIGSIAITTPIKNTHYSYELIYFGSGSVDAVLGLSNSFTLEDRDLLTGPDDDRDWIINDLDVCPFTPPGAAVNENGCSASQNGCAPTPGEWTIEMQDLYGDGWQSSTPTGGSGIRFILANGNSIEVPPLCSFYDRQPICIDESSFGTVVVTIPEGTQAIEPVFPGDYYGENSFRIISPLGNVIADYGPGTPAGPIVLDLCLAY